MAAPSRAEIASIAGLVLAAGKSARMGRDKALLKVKGEAFLRVAINTLRDGGLVRIAVVLGHHANEIQQAMDLTDVGVVLNPNYLDGQTSSLQAGLRSLDRPDLEAVVLTLVDHPRVRGGTVQTLIHNFLDSRAPVVVPTYGGQKGHPIIFSRMLFKPLLELDSSQGANTVMREYLGRTHFVEVKDPGILEDIDLPAAYAPLQ